MKIVVIGGTGLIGSKLVQRLRDGGHDVLPASPQSGVDTVTGEGLADALAGRNIVVDVANSPSFDAAPAMAFFLASGRNLMAAEAAAGISHHVVLSVVGTDRLQASGYFRAKLAQEDLVTTSGLRHTLLRSTQFFEFMSRIAGDDPSPVHVSPALVKPVAADDVAAALAAIAVATPKDGLVELAGPEAFRLCDIVDGALAAKGDPREVVVDADATYFGTRLDTDTLMPGAHPRIGALRYATWLFSQGLHHNGDPAAPRSVSAGPLHAIVSRTAGRSIGSVSSP
jgi:uncharacterized protein YbjT (DUF2867 family)